MSICAIVSIVQLPLALIASLFIDEKWSDAIIIGLMLSIAMGLFETVIAILRVVGAANWYALADIGRTLMIFVVGGWLAYNGYGHAGVLWATIGSTFVVSLLALRGCGVALRPFVIDRSAVREFLAFGGPITISGALVILYATSGRFIMADRVGLTEAGYFIAAATLCERTINMLATNLSTTIAPTIFEAHQNKTAFQMKELLSNYLTGIIIIIFPLMFLFIFASDSVGRIMLGAAVAPGTALYLPYLAIASAIMSLNQTYFSYSFSISRKTMVQTYIIIPSLIINACAIFLGIYLYGGIGAAYGAILGAIFLLLMTIRIGMAQFVMPWPSRGTLLAFLASASGIPFMVWADALVSVPAAIASMVAAAVTIAVAALALDVPLVRMVAMRAALAARRIIRR